MFSTEWRLAIFFSVECRDCFLSKKVIQLFYDLHKNRTLNLFNSIKKSSIHFEQKSNFSSSFFSLWICLTHKKNPHLKTRASAFAQRANDKKNSKLLSKCQPSRKWYRHCGCSSLLSVEIGLHASVGWNGKSRAHNDIIFRNRCCGQSSKRAERDCWWVGLAWNVFDLIAYELQLGGN